MTWSLMLRNVVLIMLYCWIRISLCRPSGNSRNRLILYAKRHLAWIIYLILQILMGDLLRQVPIFDIESKRKDLKEDCIILIKACVSV